VNEKNAIILVRLQLLERHGESHYNMLTTASKRPTTRPNLGRATGATPPEELEDTDEEVVEPLAVKELVEDVECLILDELDDSSRVEETAELDSEPEDVELALTIPSVVPVVVKLLVVIGVALGTAIVVATEDE
jgi:hypothetical protein